jgi:hypothetical protein
VCVVVQARVGQGGVCARAWVGGRGCVGNGWERLYVGGGVWDRMSVLRGGFVPCAVRSSWSVVDARCSRVQPAATAAPLLPTGRSHAALPLLRPRPMTLPSSVSLAGPRGNPSCSVSRPWCTKSPLQAAQLDGPRLRAYLTYLRRGLLADCAPPPELQTIHRLFERLALPPEPPAAGEQAGGSGEQAGDDVGGGGGGGGEEPMAVDAPQPGSSAAEELAGSVEGQPGGEWTEGRAGEAEVESAGGGGAPRTGYLFYAPGAASKALFHPDYALLLTACAPLVWLAPEALHEVRPGCEWRLGNVRWCGGRGVRMCLGVWICVWVDAWAGGWLGGWRLMEGWDEARTSCCWLPFPCHRALLCSACSSCCSRCLPVCFKLIPPAPPAACSYPSPQAAASLESRMIGAECEVSFLYNAEEQARLARLQEEAAWLKCVVCVCVCVFWGGPACAASRARCRLEREEETAGSGGS